MCCSFLVGDEEMKSSFPRTTSLGDCVEVLVAGREELLDSGGGEEVVVFVVTGEVIESFSTFFPF